MIRSAQIKITPVLFLLFLSFSFFYSRGQSGNGIKTNKTGTNGAKTTPNLTNKKIDSASLAGGYDPNHTEVKLLPPEKLSKDYTAALKQILNLSNAQYDKMLLVNRALIEKIDALVYTSKDYSTFRQGIKLADKTRFEKYKVFLTPQQLKAYSQDSSLTGLNKVLSGTKLPEGNPVMK